MHSPRPRSPVGTPTTATFQNGLGLGHPGRRKSGLRSRGTQLLALRFGWVVLVIWYEVGEVRGSGAELSWIIRSRCSSSPLYPAVNSQTRNSVLWTAPSDSHAGRRPGNLRRISSC